jgi:ribonuclease HII
LATVKRPCFKLELPFPQPLAGVDEAGCAPLAGPVVAAAVVLDRERFPRGIDDSKKLDLDTREAIYGRLQKVARIGVGIATVEEIDQINIYWARMLAMTRAVEQLGFEPAWILVDGNACPRWQRPSKAIIAGDAKCRSIAAASIVAKVTRDRIMADHAETFPGYGWETNRGYPDAGAYPGTRHAGPDATSPAQFRTRAGANGAGSVGACGIISSESLSSHTTRD